MEGTRGLFRLGMAALAVTFMVLAGCESLDTWNAVANSYSSSSEKGMTYTIYNRSSVTVTLQDSTGTVSIPPNGSASARFNSSATIYNVSYSPSSVKVTQSGYSFTFTN